MRERRRRELAVLGNVIRNGQSLAETLKAAGYGKP